MLRLSRRTLLQVVSTAAVSTACAATDLAVAPPAPARATTLRAMTFNIQSASRGLDGIAAAIAKIAPDVVALQEVDRFSRRGGGVDQAAELSARTGLTYHQHFRATDYSGGAYGVALISRYPLEEIEQLALPNSGGQEPRTVGRARIHVDGLTVSVYVTHLSHLPTNAELRASQSQAIRALIEQDPNPKLLMGDLNDGSDSKAVRVLRGVLTDAFERAGSGPSGTFPLPLFLPDLRLDYVMASPELQPKRSWVLHSDASDHYPLVAEFAIGGDAQVAANTAR